MGLSAIGVAVALHLRGIRVDASRREPASVSGSLNAAGRFTGQAFQNERPLRQMASVDEGPVR